MASLATLDDLKGHLGISDNAVDSELTRMLAGYSAMVRSYTNRDFTQQDYDLKLNGRGTTAMLFPQFPVTAVSRVAVEGADILPQGSSGGRGYRFSDTLLMLEGFAFARGWLNIRLQFTAGYAVIPADVSEAVISLCALRFAERDRIGYQSKSLAGETVTFNIRDMPAHVNTILRQYKRSAPI